MLSACLSCRELSGWAVAGAGSKLEHLSLGGCTLVTDAGVGAFARTSHGLRSLCVRQCRCISDNSLSLLAMYCPKLEALDVSRCAAISDAGLLLLAAGCPFLTTLELEGYAEVTDRGIHALAAGCRQLAALNLWVCSGVSNEGICELAVRRCCLEPCLLACIWEEDSVTTCRNFRHTSPFHHQADCIISVAYLIIAYLPYTSHSHTCHTDHVIASLSGHTRTHPGLT